jgi:hypothetical protein
MNTAIRIRILDESPIGSERDRKACIASRATQLANDLQAVYGGGVSSSYATDWIDLDDLPGVLETTEAILSERGIMLDVRALFARFCK